MQQPRGRERHAAAPVGPAPADSEATKDATRGLTGPDSVWTPGKGHPLGKGAFLDSTTIQCNMAHGFLGHHREAEDNVLQILRERAAARGWQL